jgi:hypothetical protein
VIAFQSKSGSYAFALKVHSSGLVVRVKLVPFQQSLHLKPPREPEVVLVLKSGL